jgi:dethiobiotin synthetase
MPSRKIFITGTDTDVGKTLFTAALICALQNKQQSVMAFKPVAAGCELENGQLKNNDALILIEALANKPDYALLGR